MSLHCADLVQLRPKLSDLKESGGIEISGDLVLLLHRRGQNHDESGQRVISYNTDVWIAKQRNGPADVRISTLFLTYPMRFVEVAREEQHENQHQTVHKKPPQTTEEEGKSRYGSQ